ncbi:MAG: NAD(P)-dependent oxidoreductase [Eubacteriales bacterium]
MKIGFIGLGQMGKHMALNLLNSGNKIIVCDLKTDSFKDFISKDIETTTNVLDIIHTEVIFLSLPNTKIVNEILFGEKGFIKYSGKVQTIIDLSTISYKGTLKIAHRLKKENISFIDAPVSGGEERAKKGTLTVMCGGAKNIFEEIKPLLKFIGNKIIYMGSSGKGQLTKLINQLLYDINIAALSEILPMSTKLGLDPEKIGKVVNSSSGKSYASDFFISRILKGQFYGTYSLKNAYKDLVSAAVISADFCVPLPVLHAATVTYQMALLKGYGDSDKSSMIKIYEELLDSNFRAN